MRRPLIVTAIAALATGVFLVAAATYSAPPDAVDVPNNQLRTGALYLDLSTGSASANLSFAGLMPGQTTVQYVWLAANSPLSAVGGVLTLRLDRVRDVAGPCSTSHDKARAEQLSGIGGCRVRGNSVSGTPTQGNLSRLVSLELRTATASPASSCDEADDVVVAGRPGNVRTLAGRTLHFGSDSEPELVLAPGQGVCLAVAMGWPPSVTSEADADRNHPLDNAAQGDSLQVRAVFTLSQVAP